MTRRVFLSLLVAALPFLGHGIKGVEAAQADPPGRLTPPAGETKASGGGTFDSEAAAGRKLRAEGRPLEAALHFRRAFRAAAGPERARALFELAEAFFSARYFHEAALYARLCLRASPPPDLAVSARLQLAQSLAARGFLAEAAAEFSRVGEVPEALFGRADVLQRMGRHEEAARAYQRALAADPAYPDRSEETRCLLGESLAPREPARAERLLRSVSREPFRGRAALALGGIALARGASKEAAEFFRAALGSTDRQVLRRALLHLAEASEAAGDRKEAAARLEELCARYPDSPECGAALVRLAQIRRGEGDYPAAALLLCKALGAKAGGGKELMEGAAALVREAAGKERALFGRVWEAARPVLLARADEKTLMELAPQLEGYGPAAAPLFERLARAGSPAARARGLVWLARRAAEKRDQKGAQRLLDEAREARIAPGDLQRVEAAAAVASGDRRRAAGIFLSLGPLRAEDIPLFGEVFDAAEDKRKAAALFKAAAARAGAGPRDLVRLADLLYEEGDKKGALAAYRAVLAKEPGNEWAAYRAGLLEEGRGGETLLGTVRKDRILARAAAATLRGRQIERAMEKR